MLLKKLSSVTIIILMWIIFLLQHSLKCVILLVLHEFANDWNHYLLLKDITYV